MTAIAENPLGFLDSISQVVTLLRNLGLLDDLIKALPKQIQEKQELNNPYDKNSEEALYKEYREGWYSGYLSYFIVSMVVGGQATKAAKNTKTFAKLVDKLDENGKLTAASRALDAVQDKTTGRAKRVTYRLGTRAAKGSWAISRQSSQHVVSGVKTAVGKYDVSQKLSSSKDSTLHELDTFTQKRQRLFARFTARADDNDADLENVDELARVLEEADDIDPDTTERLAKLDSNGEDIHPLLEAYDTGDIDNNDLQRAAKLLDSRDNNYDDYYVGDDVSAEDLAKIADEGADLSETELVVGISHPDTDTDTIWMELGNGREGGYGWLHIATRHISGSNGFNSEEITSFFPMGQTIRGEPIPDEDLTAQEVKELIYRTVRDGQPSDAGGDRFAYIFNPSENGYDVGITRIRVVMLEDGSVKTAIPEKGSSVKAWVPGYGWIIKDGS